MIKKPYFGGKRMNKRITFRNMEHTLAIENYANEHLAKIEKFLEHEPTPVSIDLVMEPSKTREHNRVELMIKSPHYNVIAHHEGPHFYKVLDHVIDIAMQELLKEKRKRIDGRDHRTKVSELEEFREGVPGDEFDEE
jgi:ribosomal subunit interface protein